MSEKVSRRTFVKGAVGAAAVASLSPSGLIKAAARGKSKAPNLVFVFPDQWRGQALGFRAEDPVHTPHLDRFAKESLSLPQTVANYPLCSPYRGMLMSGKYSHANKVTGNCRADRAQYGVELQQDEVCWSDVLQAQGYSLGYIGKWHLDAPREPFIEANPKWNTWCPPERRHGFDYWYSYGTYNDHNRPMYWETKADREEYHFVDQWSPEHEADKAIDYIQNEDGTMRDPDQPFALVVSMNPPHPPYHLYPDKYREPYADKSLDSLLVRPNVDPEHPKAKANTRDYYASITGVDEQFARILKAIDDVGLKEDTIVVFTSDHGDCLGTHGEVSKNNPFEESMRVPFLIRWPGKIKPGSDDLLLSTPDIYPTLLDLMGFEKELPEGLQGDSYAQLMRGANIVRPSSQLYLKIPSEAPGLGARGVRTQRYKLVLDISANKEVSRMLFDLKEDPYELENLAGSHPRVVEQLIDKELKPWLLKTGDPWYQHLSALNAAGKAGNS
ncbi:sulfatase [Pelagicoccus enzymogenes]|uniref:sulfatase family protein n=1 Tax=Pelagicoccus enzymogenes TaxID=2773457 RepID=UPI00280E635F|nr:sulfatase [Pelagicoccus enzymogenes]MDQ8198619.1 sulfatase [Pelagicoccus enzymogenes]